VFFNLLNTTDLKNRLAYLGSEVALDNKILAQKFTKFTQSTLILIEQNTDNALSIIAKTNQHFKQINLDSSANKSASVLLKKIATKIIAIASTKEFEKSFNAGMEAFPKNLFVSDLNKLGLNGGHFNYLAKILKDQPSTSNTNTNSFTHVIGDLLEDKFKARYIESLPENIHPDKTPTPLIKRQYLRK
jgi:hypothetical protein